MRGLVPDLATPFPLAGLMPAVFQEDAATCLLTEALDDVLAPVFAVLDCLDAYLDPRLAPEDFLDWLAAWVGIALNDGWSADRKRAAIGHAVELHRVRGTPRGLQWHLDLITGGRAHVVDSAGVAWSSSPDGARPTGSGHPLLLVRVVRGTMTDTELAELEDVLGQVKPAHVPHRVELADSTVD
ncbi:phage tail protein [Umezawaea endophytica]|uniref:Phage tail protein n=1 Tax=Umezawaea endophytica TaxID=1654476 RepID=A0A9X3AEP2_9PSEU|nr:phage tail protein [Umezawaea endophytica]MCS7477121.1 phage tail protein [Umezawaea endophytica]